MLESAIALLLKIDWLNLLSCYPLYIALGFTWVIYLGLKKY